MFVAVAAISFASCGNQAQPAEVETDSITEIVEVDTIAPADSVAADSATVNE